VKDRVFISVKLDERNIKVKDIANELRKIVAEVSDKLSRLDIEQVAVKKNPDKWSKKEILGHLIDSAANNHQRIVRACYGVANIFPPYDQNEWVRCGHYQELDWVELVGLWTAYNRHLSNLIERLPVAALSSPCNIGKEEPVPLEFVIKDYLRHLQHHLVQIME
jgi:DinB superfamily